MDLSFQRTTPDGDVQRTTGRFRTQPDVISDICCVTTDRIANEFLVGIKNFNRRGSNWIVESVFDFRLTYVPFRPAEGTSFIPTPREISVKNAVLNVQNTDEKCFIWSVLAALHPVESKYSPCRMYHYYTYRNRLNTNGLIFPLPLRTCPSSKTRILI